MGLADAGWRPHSSCTSGCLGEFCTSTGRVERRGVRGQQSVGMPRPITIDEAKHLIRSRSQLLERGLTDRRVADAVAAGDLIRLRRGAYVWEEQWRGLWNEGRHLLAVLAVSDDSSYAAPPFCLESAAVLHGLPLYRTAPHVVHTLVGATSHSRTRAGVARHALKLGAADLTEVGGIPCTSIERTVLDLAQRLPAESAVAIADAALRRVSVDGHDHDAESAEEWRNRMLDRAFGVSTRGIRRARHVLEFADGRAQLPGESVSRLHLHRLGFRDVGLQTHIVGPDGEDYWTDFAFASSRAFGEFDGIGKYLDGEMLGHRSTADAVLAEKRREDAIRGVTGWRIVRWESKHIGSAAALGARLASFGVRP